VIGYKNNTKKEWTSGKTIWRREQIKRRINVRKTRKQEVEYSNPDKEVMKSVRRDYR
jgi:hypothetical protein